MKLQTSAKGCTILDEFSGKQQLQYFGYTSQKVLHHIDTYYYAVFLNEPEDVVKLKSEDKLPENLNRLLCKLRDMKSYVRGDAKGKLLEISGMEVSGKVFSMYEYCVSLDECFDIFIASYLPNENTPRIVVQLRSRYLILEGVYGAILKSYQYLCDFLEPFELFPVKARINRIDYAFHTNWLVNTQKYFSDYKLGKHLKTNLKTFSKIGSIGKKINVETFTLGSRRSNNVFFRAYDKTREVIEMNDKAFFFERWLENGLISEFDAYVYRIAYELKSYRTGVLVGRLKWYLEFGSNEKLKQECNTLLQNCFVNSDNAPFIEEKIKGVIPETTTIVNIEYQTKRKFYTTCAEWMDFSKNEDFLIYDTVDMKKLVDHVDVENPIFDEMFFFLRNADAVIDYLTGYGHVVSFVKDNTMSAKEFKEDGKYCSWWHDIRTCNIDYTINLPSSELVRSYDERASVRKTRRLLAGNIARLAILRTQLLEERSFVEDMSEALCCLNDNDLPPIIVAANENGEIFEPQDYAEIRARKSRQLKGLVKKKKIIGNF